MTKDKEISLKKSINNEQDFITKLADLKALPQDTNFSLINQDTKLELEKLEKDIVSFLESNRNFDNYTEEEKNTLFDTVIAMWDSMGEKIKNAVCTIECTGIEINTITKKLHQNVEYTSETIFYGLHLKKLFLDTLPKVSFDFEKINVDITFSHAVALHHLLSLITVKGLNKDSFAYAHILYSLQEITKVYTHFNNISLRLNNAIGQWNLGLSSETHQALNEAIKDAVDAETEAKTEN